jgi:hypothetical protein
MTIERVDWVLKREIGVSYSRNFLEHQAQAVAFPIFVEYRSDYFLFVEEFYRGQFRTRCVDRRQRTVFDSSRLGVGSVLGCFINSSQIILLSRDRYQLVIFDMDSVMIGQINIASLLPSRLRFIKATQDDTLLLLAVTPDERNTLFEVDLDGNVKIALILEPSTSLITSIQRAGNDNYYLVADNSRHNVKKLLSDGRLAWQYGHAGRPGNGNGWLTNPSAIVHGYDDELLISDTRNHRILFIARDGSTHRNPDLQDVLCSPTYCTPTRDGAYCIADAGNRRLIEVDNAGRIIWQLGNPIYSRRALSFPRSVEGLKQDGALIADTCNNRIVTFDKFGSENWSFGGSDVMKWPRCVRHFSDHSFIVSDSLQSRIIFVDLEGVITRELDVKPFAQDFAPDIHDFKIMPWGLLLTDAQNAQVLLMSWNGNVHRVFRHTPLGHLKDPHAADMRQSIVAIADTGNSRILLLDLDHGLCREIPGFAQDGRIDFFRLPRDVQILDDGRLVVADSGKNRVLIGTVDGRLLSTVSNIAGSPIKPLAEPRSARIFYENSLFISDFYNHRVLHLVPTCKIDVGSAPAASGARL